MAWISSGENPVETYPDRIRTKSGQDRPGRDLNYPRTILDPMIFERQ